GATRTANSPTIAPAAATSSPLEAPASSKEIDRTF
ncbi:MAG: hypothetical protein JWN52_4867, partial [Actinomycetia bacterium]|nr:hypothetical protein [Actinomycetes bacterium]MCW2916799.1 hypothetical protein [Actinomycetes bacterium]